MTFIKKLGLGILVVVALLGCSTSALADTVTPFPTPLVVGTGSQVVPATVTLPNGGTVATIKVLTQGKVAADFTATGGGGCQGQSFGPGGSCAVPVQFAPLAPGARRGAVQLFDSNGNLLGTQMLYGVGLGSVGVLLPGTMQTVAGDGAWVYKSDGVAATAASIFLPDGVAVDDAGNIYLSDTSNNRVRRVDAVSGLISTVAGNGTPGATGDGGLGVNAEVNSPSGMVIDGAGNLLFADSGNHAVRKLTLATGVISTVAGQLGQPGATGDTGLATAALLNTPQGVALDAAGDLYIADTNNNEVRRVDAITGVITTVAGNGTQGSSGDGGPGISATLFSPWGLTVDAAGKVYIADLGNNKIRMLSAGGMISTVAGTGSIAYNGDGEAATAANLGGPAAVAVDVAGNLYIADSGNNRIRKVGVATQIISTVAGTGDEQFSGDGGPATTATMYGPYALGLDSFGNVFFSDIFHHRIREIENTVDYLTYPAIRVGRTSAPQAVTVENDGNADLHFTALDPDNSSAVDPGTTTCSTTTALTTDTTCLVGAEFVPQVVGNPVNAVIQVKSDASNSPIVLNLSGEVDALDPTHTTLNTSLNPAAIGASVTFSAGVTTTGSTPPTGTVKFYDGTTLIGTGTITAGVATFTTTTLALGSHTITADYGGDAANSPSVSVMVTEVVKQQPTVTVSSSVNPSQVGVSVTFSATVVAPSVIATGNVNFLDGTNVIGTQALAPDGNGNAVATFTTTTLVAGTHTITATYVGDTNSLTAGSPAVSQVVNLWTTTTMLTSNTPTPTVGTALSLSVHVAITSAVAATGSVKLLDGSTLLATLTLDGSGNATYSTSSLAPGSHGLVATFVGDTTNAGSSSAALSETVETITTGTVVTASANPGTAGTTIRFTATVTPASTNATAVAPSGTVTFTDGTTTLGTGQIANGVAVLDVTTLTVGTHPIVATYAGSTDFAGSASATYSETVQLAATTVTLTSSANPSIAGKGITITAVVSGNGGVPTGTITFLDGGTTLGTATVNASGQASLSLGTLGSGTHSVTASYGGDAKNGASVSTALSEVIQQATTAIVLTSSANPGYAGASITFVATLTSNGGLPTGSIVLTDGGTVIGTQAMSGTGSASFTFSNLSTGTHSLLATFAGDADHAASASPVLTEVIQIGTSAVTLLSSKNPSAFGSAVTFSVGVTGTAVQPTGNVALMDGGTLLATLPLNGAGTATYSTSTLAIGDHPITAVYGGDSIHASSTSVVVTERVQQVDTVAVTSSKNPSIVGDMVQFTATISGVSGAPTTGTVSFSDAGTVLGTATVNGNTAVFGVSTLVAGTHLIVATYSGDATNQGATSAALAQAVNTAGTTITLASSANPSVTGSPVTFTATVASLGETPKGSVAFLDGSTTIGTGTVAAGVATFTTSSLSPGQHVITARYGGDAGTQVSTSGVLLQVTQMQTHISLASSVNPALTVQSIQLTATVTNGASATGIVTFTDGSTSLGSVVLGGDGTATLTVPALAAGSHTLVAAYGGDSQNLPSTTAPLSETVQLRASSTTMTVSSNNYVSGQQVTLVGVVQTNGPVAPTGTVTFTSGGNLLGTAPVSAAGAATFTIFPLDPSYSIVATYSGDAVYSGSAAAAYTITSGPSTTFTMTPSWTTNSISSGTHTVVNLTLTSVKGFTDTLALGCLELPADATCTFSSDKTLLAANGTEVITLTIDTGNPLGAGGVAKLRGPDRSRRSGSSMAPLMAGGLLPGVILLGVMLARSRRRGRLPGLLALVVMCGLGFGLVGCANQLVQNSTPAGTYTVRVIASGAGTGASQVSDLSLTVTK
jgi:sugar lactone lactonase YvrE